MTRSIRWGVLSTANIGRRAVNPAIQASTSGELIAVASRDPDRARAFAEEHGIPTSLGSYAALVASPDVDALYIPLPNSLHREWVIRAANAGKHVLCEKPLGLNARECIEMHAAAEANSVRLMEAFMYRFHPRMQAVVQHIQSGAIGEARSIQSAFTFRLNRPDNIRLDPDLGGGALMDVGCYCVNVSRTLMSAEPVSVRATARWTERGVDDELSGELLFSGGAVAQISCGLTQARRETVEVGGTEGWIRIPSAFLPGTGKVDYDVHGPEREDHPTFAGTDQYRAMVEHFNHCVLMGQAPRYGALEAARNMAVIDALYESARKDGSAAAVELV